MPPPEALLEVEGLHVTFKRHLVRAVDGVSLRVAPGEVLGLVGESGCGKTTLARAILGMVGPDAGSVSLSGVQLQARRTVAQRRAIQMVFQDPYSSLNPRMTVRQILSELLKVHKLVPRDRVADRVAELASMVGLATGALDRYPSQFSGGQRQRIAIARALVVEPTLVIADEPVSALDVSVQATILRLFGDLRTRLGLAIVLISHDLAVVRHLCDRVAVMYLGRIVETGTRDAIFGDPRHPYTRALLEAAPSLTRAGAPAEVELKGEPPGAVDLPPGCRFHPRCLRAEAVCSEVDPPFLPPSLESTGGHDPTAGHLVACHFRDDPAVPR